MKKDPVAVQFVVTCPRTGTNLSVNFPIGSSHFCS